MIHLESAFTVSLALTAHRQAEQLRQQHSDPHKAKQVYLNALALYAVEFYLECLGFQARSTLSHDHWLMDSATLHIQNCGALECRPVLPHETHLRIPAEVWSDRIGYVAVQLSESLREAAILGYVPTATAESVSLTELQPLDALLTHLQRIQQPDSAPVNLGAWLQNVADASWRAIGEFFDPILNPAQPAVAFRGDRPPSPTPGEPTRPLVQRGKALTLQMESTPIPLVLLLGLAPLSSQEVDIWVQLETPEQTPLPPMLELLVLDDTGAEVMYAQARSTEAMQLQFTAAAGEQFGVQIRLDDQTLTETFVVGLDNRA